MVRMPNHGFSELENLKKTWDLFVSSGLVPQEKIRPLIYQSWLRCKQLRVNPYQTSVHKFLDPQAVAEKLNENMDLINIALPIMNKLYEFVKGSGFLVTITDSECYLLEILGDLDLKKSAAKGNFKIGANWSEQHAGTNAIGTAMFCNEPLQVFAYEHYCKCSHRWTCSGAPIHDPADNKIIGILNMTGRYENVNSHTLGMVYAAVHAIENEIALRNAWMSCEVANSQKAKIIDSIGDGIIAIDQTGKITQLNNISCHLLGFDKNIILNLNQNIKDMLGPQNSALYGIFKQEKEVTDQQINIVNIFSRQKYSCTATSRLIRSECNTDKGKVVLLCEIKRAQKLASQLLGNKAYFTFEHLIGQNDRFLQAIDMAKSAATSSSSVLLLGESGTGKEIFAQAIHSASPRRDGPFLAINCSGMPRELIGSELFGYIEGAFTGAKKGGNPGKFELADGGTLFLDEIGDMPLDLQSVLLRVLEEKTVTRLGSGESIPIDVRIISATNKNLWEEVKFGNFRDDLFFRLNVLTIKIPPLRERKEDIYLLMHHFINKLALQQNKEISYISPDAVEILCAYNWPGNVRQLQNILERMINITKDRNLTVDHLPEEIKNSAVRTSGSYNILEVKEKDVIINLLVQHNRNLSKVAKELKIARSTLYRKLAKYRLDKVSF